MDVSGSEWVDLVFSHCRPVCLGAALVPHLPYSPARLYLRPAQPSILRPVRQLPHGGNHASLFLVFVFMLCNFLVSPISLSSPCFTLLQLNYLDPGLLEESLHPALVPWYSQFLPIFHSELQPGSAPLTHLTSTFCYAKTVVHLCAHFSLPWHLTAIQ